MAYMDPQAIDETYPRICSEVGLACETCTAATARSLASVCKGLRGKAITQLFVQIYPQSACSPMHAHFVAAYQEASAEPAEEMIPMRREVTFARPRALAAVA